MSKQSMQVVYTLQTPPHSFDRAIFLAGPTPRAAHPVPSWRPEALRLLAAMGYDGVVFVPENADGRQFKSNAGIKEWEHMALHMSDAIVFWLPRDMTILPALTTNDEWGTWKYSGKVVFGAPPDAVKVAYQQHYARLCNVPMAESLQATLENAVSLVGKPALRSAAERNVPLFIWRTAMFQHWYRKQCAAGNRLDGAEVKWVHKVRQGKQLFMCVLHVNVYIAAEQRNKTNEVVVFRPDTATVLLYHRPEGADLMATEIAMVKEFRSPAATDDGYVFELPSGSSFDANQGMHAVAAAECFEETGIAVKQDRLRLLGKRQLAATAMAHQSHLYAVEATAHEMAVLRAKSVETKVSHDTGELTHPRVVKLGEVIRDHNVDWSNLGMIMSLLHSEALQ